MENSGKTIIGIVVRKSNTIYSSKFYVWSNETYTGADGYIIVPEDQNVKPGDWVTVSFTKEEADLYFPPVKSPQAPRFFSRNFHVIPELYETKVDGGTVRVSFNYNLSVDQAIIYHHFFEKIYNNKEISTPNGLRKITIRRFEPDGERDTVWVLDRTDNPEIALETEKTVMGIVAGQDSNVPNLVFVWCKETVPGFDVTIQYIPDAGVLELGKWIQMKFTPSEYSTYFAPNRSFNIHCGRYSEMKPIHKTVVRGKTIGLELECYIEGNAEVKDIWHPFVGVIHNEKWPFLQSGEYSIEITRGKKKTARDGLTESVWFLVPGKLVKPTAISQLNLPISSQELIDPQVYRQKMHVSGVVTFTSITSPPTLTQLAQSLGQVQLQTRDFPETRRNLPQTSEASSPSPPQSPVSSRHLAMITKIEKIGNFERIYLWLMDIHKRAILKLSISAEKENLKQGSIFKADFTHNGENISSTGPIQRQNDPSYDTIEQPKGVLVRIYSEMCYLDDREHRWPRIWHDHFGDVYDNRRKLSQTNASIKRHVWIRRAKVLGEIQWVIVEEIV